LQHLHRTWLIALLLAAVMLRSLVADGYMPGEDGVVRLCTPEGMVAVVIDPETGEAVELEETASAECPWAYALFPGALLPTLVPWPIRHTEALSPVTRTGSLPVLQPARLPPARAPPVLSC